MKIAVTGKGGVGKTTFAATLARLYADEGKHVLAADVDPDANLGLALGFSQEEPDCHIVQRHIGLFFADERTHIIKTHFLIYLCQSFRHCLFLPSFHEVI